jgi:hypothetical protein
MDVRGPDLLHGVAQGLRGGASRNPPMSRSRARRGMADVLSLSPQLRLAIEDTDVFDQTTPIRTIPLSSLKEVDPILWIRDLQAVFDVHRCTIHRWIKRGDFPPKDAPAESPRGWLRSTVIRWQRGAGSGRSSLCKRLRKNGDASL